MHFYSGWGVSCSTYLINHLLLINHCVHNYTEINLTFLVGESSADGIIGEVTINFFEPFEGGLGFLVASILSACSFSTLSLGASLILVAFSLDTLVDLDVTTLVNNGLFSFSSFFDIGFSICLTSFLNIGFLEGFSSVTL